MYGLVVRLTYFLLGFGTVVLVGWVVPRYILPEDNTPLPDFTPQQRAHLQEVRDRHARIRKLEDRRQQRWNREWEARMDLHLAAAYRAAFDALTPPRGVCGWVRR